MNLVTRIVASLMFTMALFVGMGSQAFAQFDPLDKACTGITEQDSANPICNASSNPVDPVNGDDSIIVTIANLLAMAAAIIAVVVIIIAGITMMTSNGDAGKVATSRSAIIYTVIGLLVIVSARTIVVFVILRSAT